VSLFQVHCGGLQLPHSAKTQLLCGTSSLPKDKSNGTHALGLYYMWTR